MTAENRGPVDLGPLLRAYDAAPDKRAFLRAHGPCVAVLVAAAAAVAVISRQMIDEDGGGAVFAELHRQAQADG